MEQLVEHPRIITLLHVVYDERAMNGTWCQLPYDGHPKGCPQFPKCPQSKQDFLSFPDLKWYAIMLEFNLQEHEQEMRTLDWVKTRKQARNVYYWQNAIRAQLRKICKKFVIPNGVILEIPEAHGINLYKTMSIHSIDLKAITKDISMVYKIMLVGNPRETLDEWFM